MKIVVGLDIGGSTTKIVGMRGKEIVAKEIVRAGDPVTSAFGAVGKLINDHGLKPEDISRINIHFIVDMLYDVTHTAHPKSL